MPMAKGAGSSARSPISRVDLVDEPPLIAESGQRIGERLVAIVLQLERSGGGTVNHGRHPSSAGDRRLTKALTIGVRTRTRLYRLGSSKH